MLRLIAAEESHPSWDGTKKDLLLEETKWPLLTLNVKLIIVLHSRDHYALLLAQHLSINCCVSAYVNYISI